MEIVKKVDLETLTEAEKADYELGAKTEEDFLAEHEAAEAAKVAEEAERLKKAEELATNYKIRAEKAEAEAKAKSEKKVEENTTPTNDSLTQSDLLAIVRANIAEEDIDEVKDYAHLKNISVAEALKTSVVKTILSEKDEERKTANATNTGSGRRGSDRQTPSQLLENAKKGILPDNDDDLEKLILARKGLLK